MDPFSVLESIGAIAIALLGMAVSQPMVIAVLQWLGYRIYMVEDQHQHDVLDSRWEWESLSLRHLELRGPFALQPLRLQRGLQCGLEQPRCAGIQEEGGGQGGGGWERNRQ